MSDERGPNEPFTRRDAVVVALILLGLAVAILFLGTSGPCSTRAPVPFNKAEGCQ